MIPAEHVCISLHPERTLILGTTINLLSKVTSPLVANAKPVGKNSSSPL